MKIPVVFLLQLSTICLGQNSFEKEMDKLHFKTQKIRDSLSIEFTKYKEANEKNGEILEGLWTVYDSTFVVDAKSDLQFAKSHTNSLELLQLLNIRMSRQESMDLYQDYEIAFQNFSSELQQSPDGKKMEEKLINFKNSKVGSIAPDFYAIDINEKKINLKDLRGKIILIDFWASWCGPCREEFPFLKELSKSYANKDFVLISISKDEDLKKWKDAIQKEKTFDWLNISTFQNNNKIEDKYFVTGIPHKILIDRNGLIIGKWKGSGSKNKRELKATIDKFL